MQKLKINIKKMPKFRILANVLEKTIKSKYWIILTSIFMLIAFVVILIPVVMQKSPIISRTILVFVPLCVMFVYLTLYEILFIWKNFSLEMKDGIMNLEIRSGYSRTRIFWERVIANKIISLFTILFFIFLFFIIHVSSPTPFDKIIAYKYSQGLFFLIIFDMTITAILLLFSTLKANVILGIIGTIVLVFFTITPFVVEPIHESFKWDASSKTTNYRLNQDNYRIALAKEVNEIENYDNSYILQIRKELQYIAKDWSKIPEDWLIDDKGKPVQFKDGEYIDTFINIKNNHTNGKAKGYFDVDSFKKNYVSDLLWSGLFNEIENLPLSKIDDKSGVSSRVEFWIKLPDDVKTKFDNLKINIWSKQLKEMVGFDYGKDKDVYNQQNLRTSFFYVSNGRGRSDFSAKYDYFDVKNRIYEEIKDQQWVEILNLIDKVINTNYYSYRDSIISELIQNYWWGNPLLFSEVSFETDAGKYLTISPGQRMIQKVLFDILTVTQIIPNDKYDVSHEHNKHEWITPDQAKKHMQKENIVPFLMMYKQMYHINNDPLYDLALQKQTNKNSWEIPTYMYKVKGWSKPNSEVLDRNPLEVFSENKNYDSIEMIGTTINVPVSYVVVIIVMLLVVCLGFYIFYRKIIF